MSKNKSQTIELPACDLRLDGNTFPHRAALAAKGWVWSKGSSAWRKSHPGGKIVVREGCRLVAESGNLGVVYDATEGKYSAPNPNDRRDFDEI